MKSNTRVFIFGIGFFFIFLVVAGCAPGAQIQTQEPQTVSAPDEIPTWTPRPGTTSQALPPPTETATVVSTFTPGDVVSPTPSPVTVAAAGGNINIRRGPGTDYNYSRALLAGQSTTATARDFLGEWVYVSVPGEPGTFGWVSLLTPFTKVSGDVDDLPVRRADPALGAYIRNCTKSRLLVLPDEVELLSKFEEPFNIERFGPGLYQVYDLTVGGNEPIAEVALSEGKTVDILVDGTGDRSKCE